MMALPRQVKKALLINLLSETIVVRSAYFAAKTDNEDVVVVRRSKGLMGISFEVHDTPTESRATARTVLARAEDRLYHQLLNNALESAEVRLPYVEFDYASCEPAP